MSTRHAIAETLWRWAVRSGSPENKWRLAVIRLGHRWEDKRLPKNAPMPLTFWRQVAESDAASQSWKLVALQRLSENNSAANLRAISCLLLGHQETRIAAQACLRKFGWMSHDLPEETFVQIAQRLAMLNRIADAPELLPILTEHLKRSSDAATLKLYLSAILPVINGTPDIDTDPLFRALVERIERNESIEEVDLCLETMRITLLYQERKRTSFEHYAPRVLAKFRRCASGPRLPRFEAVLDLLDIWKQLPSDVQICIAMLLNS
jgi:hypothetical protein